MTDSYKDQIIERYTSINKLLDETSKTSQKITTDLLEQSETLNRIENHIDRIEQHVVHSHAIVNRMKSFFSFFRSFPVFHYHEPNNKNLSNIKQHELNQQIQTSDDPMDEILLKIREIKQQALNHGDLLTDSNDQIERITEKTNDNIGKIKKVSVNIHTML